MRQRACGRFRFFDRIQGSDRSARAVSRGACSKPYHLRSGMPKTNPATDSRRLDYLQLHGFVNPESRSLDRSADQDQDVFRAARLISKVSEAGAGRRTRASGRIPVGPAYFFIFFVFRRLIPSSSNSSGNCRRSMSESIACDMSRSAAASFIRRLASVRASRRMNFLNSATSVL